MTLLKLFSILNIEFLSPIGPWFHSHVYGPFNLLSIGSPFQSLKERPPFKLDKNPSCLKELSQLLYPILEMHQKNLFLWILDPGEREFRSVDSNARNIYCTLLKKEKRKRNTSCTTLKMKPLLKFLFD